MALEPQIMYLRRMPGSFQIHHKSPNRPKHSRLPAAALWHVRTSTSLSLRLRQGHLSGPSLRVSQDEQDFLPWISYIERWIRATTELRRAAARTLSMPPSSEFVWEGYCLQSSSHHRPSGLWRGDLRLLFCCLSGFFTLIHPYRALGSTRGRHHGLPFGLVSLLRLQPSNTNAAFSRGRFFLSHAEAGWIASIPTARNFLLPRGQGRVAWLGGVCYITQVSMAAINLRQVSDILLDVTIKPALTWVCQWLPFFRQGSTHRPRRVGAR